MVFSNKVVFLALALSLAMPKTIAMSLRPGLLWQAYETALIKNDIENLDVNNEVKDTLEENLENGIEVKAPFWVKLACWIKMVPIKDCVELKINEVIKKTIIKKELQKGSAF